jgi:hypothetical protein
MLSPKPNDGSASDAEAAAPDNGAVTGAVA